MLVIQPSRSSFDLSAFNFGTVQLNTQASAQIDTQCPSSPHAQAIADALGQSDANVDGIFVLYLQAGQDQIPSCKQVGTYGNTISYSAYSGSMFLQITAEIEANTAANVIGFTSANAASFVSVFSTVTVPTGMALALIHLPQAKQEVITSRIMEAGLTAVIVVAPVALEQAHQIVLRVQALSQWRGRL